MAVVVNYQPVRVIKYYIRPTFNWPWRLQDFAISGIHRMSDINREFHTFILGFLFDGSNLFQHVSDFWVLLCQHTQRVVRCAQYECATSGIRFPYVGNERLWRDRVRELGD